MVTIIKQEQVGLVIKEHNGLDYKAFIQTCPGDPNVVKVRIKENTRHFAVREYAESRDTLYASSPFVMKSINLQISFFKERHSNSIFPVS